MRDKNLAMRISYDEENDEYVLETYDEEYGWGFCCSSKCVRREGAEQGEGTNFVHFTLIKEIMNALHLGYQVFWKSSND